MSLLQFWVNIIISRTLVWNFLQRSWLEKVLSVIQYLHWQILGLYNISDTAAALNHTIREVQWSPNSLYSKNKFIVVNVSESFAIGFDVDESFASKGIQQAGHIWLKIQSEFEFALAAIEYRR